MNESSGYSREEVNASVANKDSFFANLKAENNSRPDDLPPSQGGKYAGFGSSSVRNSGDGTGDYAKEDLDRSAANKESFFSGLMSKNASRPDNLPPSQGGKYAGFGSTSMPNSSSSSRSSTGSGSHGGSRSACKCESAAQGTRI